MALYTYLYTWIWIDQQLDRYVDYKRNVKWIRSNRGHSG